MFTFITLLKENKICNDNTVSLWLSRIDFSRLYGFLARPCSFSRPNANHAYGPRMDAFSYSFPRKYRSDPYGPYVTFYAKPVSLRYPRSVRRIGRQVKEKTSSLKRTPWKGERPLKSFERIKRNFFGWEVTYDPYSPYPRRLKCLTINKWKSLLQKTLRNYLEIHNTLLVDCEEDRDSNKRLRDYDKGTIETDQT